jgi:HEAT repeat protein
VADARGANCVATLSEALSHRAWDVRRLAAELLGGLGDRRARVALLARRDHEVDDLALEAMEQALNALGGD